MKILIYSHFYLPESGAAPVRVKYLTQVLKDNGFEVKVITPKPNYPQGKILPGYDKFIVKDYANKVIYLPIFFTGKHSALGRLLSYISYFIVSLIFGIFSGYKPDIIINSSPPITTAFAAMLLSKIKGSKFVFDIRDIWPDIGIQLGIIRNELSARLLGWVEKQVLHNSSAITVTAQGDKENIVNKIGTSIPVELITNGADTKLFYPKSDSEKAEIRSKCGLPLDKKILVYFGSYNHGMNDVAIFTQLFSKLNYNLSELHFLSIGVGDQLASVKHDIEKLISSTFLESKTLNEVAELISACDVSLIPRKQIEKDTGGNIPVKCFESWSAGLPVLLSNIADSEVSHIFERCGAGKLVPAGDVTEYQKGLLELLNADNRKDMGLKGRTFVEQNYDRYTQAEKLINIINDLEND